MLAAEVTPRAAAQIERAASWWRLNRPAAQGAVADDFEAAIQLLAQQPGVGSRSTSQRYPDLRRLFLSRLSYHVYYRVEPGKIVVLAFWHASRETGPQL